jgi:hypothetical protein
MAEHDPHGPAAHDNPEVDHEKSDVNVSAVVKFAAGLVAFAVVVHLILAGVFGILGRKTEREQPRLTVIAKQEREREQKKIAERVEELRKSPKSPPTPQPPQVYERLRTTIPMPRLQVNDEADLAALRKEEEAKLTRYEWVDEKAGVVQIPIEQAMRLLADPKRAGTFGIKVKGGEKR